MSENSTTLDALTRMAPESDADIKVRHQAEADVRNLITTLDPSRRRLESYGTVTITLQQDGQAEQVTMRIKSISGHVMSKIRSSEVFPQLPIKKNPAGEGFIDDESAPDYLPKLQETHAKVTRMKYLKVLYGLDMDIMSVDGTRIVWSRSAGEERDEIEAIHSLQAIGLSDAALNKISLAIDELSEQTQTVEQSEVEKKS